MLLLVLAAAPAEIDAPDSGCRAQIQPGQNRTVPLNRGDPMSGPPGALREPDTRLEFETQPQPLLFIGIDRSVRLVVTFCKRNREWRGASKRTLASLTKVDAIARRDGVEIAAGFTLLGAASERSPDSRRPAG